MYGIDPVAYKNLLRESDPYFDEYYDEVNLINEDDIDENEMLKVIAKYDELIDEEDEEYDDIPYLEDIILFFEDKNNRLYKNAFNDYYRELFGIIDCKIIAAPELIPFTDRKSYVVDIIHKRHEQEKELCYTRLFGEGWNYDNSQFYGYCMSSKFFHYPSRFIGLTLKYVYKYYPSKLKMMSENGIVIIPNKLLNTLRNSQLTRDIRMNQEKHLTFSPILEVNDVINGSEYCGVQSSYQGKRIKEIIYTRGGTKYLVSLLRFGHIDIEKSVISELLDNSQNEIETRCYKILLSDANDSPNYQSGYCP